MLAAIMFYLFVIVGLINVLHFGFNIVGANVYDIKQILRDRKKVKAKRQKKPLVTVLIPAHNETKAIIRCLDTARTSSYRKLEIIVIDDASTDNTRKLVRDYIQRYHYRDIKLMYRQKNAGKAAALNHALRKGVKGDLVMTLDADSVLHKDAIKNAVAYFKDERIAGVAANVRIMDNFTVLGLLQKFEHMIGYRSKKFYTLTNSEFIVGGVASTYRREVLKLVKFYDQDTVTEDIGLSLKVVALGNKDYKIVYASDVVAMTEGVQTFKALMRQRYRWKMGSLQNLLKNRQLVANRSSSYSRVLTFYRLPMAFLGELMVLMEPFILFYILYLSVKFQNPSLIIGAYITITLYILWNLWPDEHTTIKQKVKLSACAPVMYFIFYIMNVVQFTAIVRCLFNYKQVMRKQKTGSSWISPERTGEAVQFS